MGEPEGHTALGSYLYAIGRTEEGEKEWDKAIEKAAEELSKGEHLWSSVRDWMRNRDTFHF